MKLAARAMFATIAALAAAACDNPLAVKATSEVKVDTVLVYAFNGTPAGAPAGLHLLSHSVVSLDGTFGFDLAFDINSSSKAVVYPVQKIANSLTSTNRVGIQRVTGTTFANLSKAPVGSYQYDSTFVVDNDAPIAVEVTDAVVCSAYTSSGVYYAKIAVLGIDTVNRLMRVAVTVDPNCGFRSFASGVPKD